MIEHIKPHELKPHELKPHELKPHELKPHELKPHELKPHELKPHELKPHEFKPHEFNPKRIRDKAPYRKSMSLTEEDLMRASELERLFTKRYPYEAPFNFSKTISKALEIAIGEMLKPAGLSAGGKIQQALSGLPAD